MKEKKQDYVSFRKSDSVFGKEFTGLRVGSGWYQSLKSR